MFGSLFVRALSVLIVCVVTASGAYAQGVTLSGRVTSSEEGAMEGVVVSAQAQGSVVTISVVTDNKGVFRFPAAKLAPARYNLSIRAVGFDLDGPQNVDLSSGNPAEVAIRLRKTKQLWAQLSDGEWGMSIPGTTQQKQFLENCNGCHSYQRIMKSTNKANEWPAVIARMTGYYPGSTPQNPQRLVGEANREGLTRGVDIKGISEWLASINLSADTTWKYEIKTLPRVKGRGTRVVITEYDLPRPTAEPHDVIVDKDGMVWYCDFGANIVGKMDPRTGKVTDYALPVVKKGFPVGTLDLQFDPAGDIWVTMMAQGAIAKIERATGKVSTYPLPAEWQKDTTQINRFQTEYSDVDGKFWVRNSDGNRVHRFDPKTGKWEDIGSHRTPDTNQLIRHYGVIADPQNNLWLLDWGAAGIGKVDRETGKLVSYHRTVTQPYSRPRRGMVDRKGLIWFGEYSANAVGMFDPAANKMHEWKLPTPWSLPYDVTSDKNGEAWTASMFSDRVARLNPKTGEFTEYPLPRFTNGRRVFVDNSTTPVTFWIGSNHGASIVKLEPLD